MLKKLALSIFVVLFIGCATLTTRLYTLGQQSQNMMPLGLIEGRLATCPEKPNCTNSEYPDDADHYVTPLLMPNTSWDLLKDTLRTTVRQDGGEVKQVNEFYLASEYTSQTFEFVDDLEFRFDPNQEMLHIRSASRVGYSDLDANSERVQRIKKIIQTLSQTQ